MPEFLEILKAIIFGVVEGITEWLPVSSTGHIILLDKFIPLLSGMQLSEEFIDEFKDMFEVVIQLGAILAVVIMFFSKLNPFASSKSNEEKKRTWTLWFKVVIASVPAAFVGIVVDKLIEIITGGDIDHWLYWEIPIAIALIVYGVLFIVIEKWQKNKPVKVERVDDISYPQALMIGGFQMLAIIPGTSRSGSTILGSRILGIARPAAAEFSFFMGIPAMVGASLLKGLGFFEYVLKSGVNVPWIAWVVLAVASVVAFGVSMVAIKFLMEFVKKHSFAPFGIYRIILGALVLLYFIPQMI